MQQEKVILNHENADVPNVRKGETRHRKYKRFKFAAIMRTAVQVIRQPL
jgi:hypothetical protein